jgi:chemotaxis protein CheZ
MNVVQACSFQDVPGQRVSTLVKSLAYVEDRVNALVDIRGKEILQAV